MKTRKMLQEASDYYGSLIRFCKIAAQYLKSNGYIITSWDNRGNPTQMCYPSCIDNTMGKGELRLPAHFYVKFTSTHQQDQGSFACYGFSLCPYDPVLHPTSETGRPLEYESYGYVSKVTLPCQQDYFYDVAHYSVIERIMWPIMADPPDDMPVLMFTPEDLEVINMPSSNWMSLALVPFRLDDLVDKNSVEYMLENALGRL
jgi:hypothetical protein